MGIQWDSILQSGITVGADQANLKEHGKFETLDADRGSAGRGRHEVSGP